MSKRVIIIYIATVLLGCNKQNTKNSRYRDSDSTNTSNQISVPEKIMFPSLDSLLIHANLYHKSDNSPVIILCHQAQFSKFEYAGIAKTLWEMDYNCLAIDQRSGNGIVDELNETYLEAINKKKPVDFLDAEQDIVAAVNFAAKKYNRKVILWGSSYSSVLSLYIAATNENIQGVIAFSPGDYLAAEKGSLKLLLKDFNKPMFITSSREESNDVKDLISLMNLTETQIHFIPDSNGYHGSKALWRTSKNNEEYWKAVKAFLNKIN